VPRENLLPEALGAWKRTALADAPAPPPSDAIPRGIKRVQKAAYAGAGKIDVTLYEMTSSGLAFEALQKWRPAAGTLFFQRDEFFVLIHYDSPDRAAVNAFVRDLDRHLTKK
jgi:hypothetical protein